MALVAQEIPKVGLVMESARLVRWLKNVGDIIAQGEPLLELETEKTVLTIEATASGRLVQVLLGEDQEARVGDRIAWIDNETGSNTDAPLPDRRSEPQSQEQSNEPLANPASRSFEAPDTGRVRSSPIARRLSAEHGLDLAGIAGSGPRGRVQLEDVRRVLTAQAVPGQQLSSMRRAIARAMTLSNATIPQFTVTKAVDWTTLQLARAEISAALPAGSHKLSVNDFVLQAVADALLRFPAMNATFSGNPERPESRITSANGAHIGLVVAIDDGLLVPILHGVEKMGLAEIARRRSECVERALSQGLRPEELEGATISISNLGARGPDRFTALVNPPQSAILAVGRQRDCVVPGPGGIRVRPISELSLSVDHRVADGRLASEFLTRLVEFLEGNEWRMTGGNVKQAVGILGSYWTLGVGADPLGDQRCLHDFRKRVEIAARAGFKGMGFWHADIQEILRTYSFKDMKRILNDHGIVHIEVEWLLDWFCTGARRDASNKIRALLLEAAESLGARHIKIGDLGNDCADIPKLTEEFAVLCRQAAERGVPVLFEMLPRQFSRVPSLDDVLAICRGAGARNGGIMLDNLHVQRTGTTAEDIARKIGREIPLGVEINDGSLATPVKFEDSVVNKRLLPGDGEFDISAFLRAIWSLGYDGPIGVEVLNEYMRKWSLETAATEAFIKTQRVTTAAREQFLASRTK